MASDMTGDGGESDLLLVPIADWAVHLNVAKRRLDRWIAEVAALLDGPEPIGGCLTRPQLDQFLTLKQELARKRRKERRAAPKPRPKVTKV